MKTPLRNVLLKKQTKKTSKNFGFLELSFPKKITYFLLGS